MVVVWWERPSPFLAYIIKLNMVFVVIREFKMPRFRGIEKLLVDVECASPIVATNAFVAVPSVALQPFG